MVLPMDTKTLVIIAAVLALLYYLYKEPVRQPVHNKGSLSSKTSSNKNSSSKTTKKTNSSPKSGKRVAPSSEKMPKTKSYAPPANNSANPTSDTRSGPSEKSSYDGAKRGYTAQALWEDYVDDSNSVLLSGGNPDGDNYAPMSDDGAAGFASFESKYKDGRGPCGSNQNCSPEDQFNSSNYLPNEMGEWGDTVPVRVKSANLINVTTGVGAITSTKRNSSHDLRGTIVIEKECVGPWNCSTIDPDTNITSWC
jgi:hypothetical protein